MNRYWPCWGERGSRTGSINSRRISWASRAGCRSPPAASMAASPATENVWPSTAASWRSARSSGPSRSRRAPITACSESGTASSGRSPTSWYPPPLGTMSPRAMSMRSNSTPYNGTPAALSTTAATASSGRPGVVPFTNSTISGRLERSEMDGDRARPVGAPGGALFGELGAGDRHHQDRHARPPLGQLVDEVEEGGVRPMSVLEHQHRRPLRRYALEEDTHRRVQLAPLAFGRGPDAEHGRQPGHRPITISGVGQVLVERRL